MEQSLKTTREELEKLDREDPLKQFGEEFNIPEGILYFDGNSLGALPKATLDRVNEVVSEEWGKKLITSWNIAGWYYLSEKIGNKIATLIGADDGEVICVDGTGLNIYKVHAVAFEKEVAGIAPVARNRKLAFFYDIDALNPSGRSFRALLSTCTYAPLNDVAKWVEERCQSSETPP